MTGLQYTILHPWLSLSAGRAPFTGLSDSEERFLCSSDSMTSLLEGIYGAGIKVAAVARRRRLIDNQSSAYLQVREGGEALVRAVWIKAADEPLIYAFSLIPLEGLEGGLLGTLERGDPEPMGRTLKKEGIDFTKKYMEAGVIRCTSVAEDLGLPLETAFFARRYVLIGEKAGATVIKAAITEVFSPRLISTENVQV